MPFAVNVLTFEGEQIKEVDAFILRGSQDPDPEVQARTPEQPADYEKLAKAYAGSGSLLLWIDELSLLARAGPDARLRARRTCRPMSFRGSPVVSGNDPLWQRRPTR